MKAAELALDCSCLWLFRTGTTNISFMQNPLDFISSPTEDQGNSTQAANPKRAIENCEF